MPDRYAHEWAYFVDWALAFDHPYLPTTPRVVAEFLTFENPSHHTRRAAASAINAVHRANELLPPGRSTLIRAMLSAREPTIDDARSIIANLPPDGPPAHRNRRGALLLWLNQILRIPLADIARLRTDDIQVNTDYTIEVIPHDLTVTIDASDPHNFVYVLDRWLQVYLATSGQEPKSRIEETPVSADRLHEIDDLLSAQSLPLIPQINRADRITRTDDPDARGLSSSSARAAIRRAVTRATTRPAGSSEE